MNLRILFFISVIGMYACTGADAPLGDAAQIHLSWEFLGNDIDQGVSESVFIIKNNGKQELNDNDWKFYFNQMHLGILEHSISGNVQIKHINGDLYCLSPREGFHLPKGSEVRISYKKKGRIINACEAPGGAYFVFEDSKGNKGIGVPGSFEILPFPGLDQIFPEGSGVPLPDAAWLYRQNVVGAQGSGDEEFIMIPQPYKYVVGEGSCEVDGSWVIDYGTGLEEEASYLAGMLKELLGIAPAMVNEGEENGLALRLRKQASDNAPCDSYRLQVCDHGIDIVAPEARGIFYGIQSLLSLFPAEAWGSINEKLQLRHINIYDRPSFEYRGMMLDVARNFHTPGTIMKMIDAMAFYKLNKLHLSLTNDEAWRIEIPDLPELTDIGAFRGHTEDSKDHLIPTYGSGPYPDPEHGLGSGFLTRQEFIELLKYAASRHIEIIPEVNFPGHARAAIYAMEARYDRLAADGRMEDALRYRLIDPDDASVYNSAQNFHDNVVCVCKDAPYRFYEKVVDELMLMYREAGLEMRMLHAGGDEVPSGSWSASPLCSDFLDSHPELGGVEDLQPYFEGRILAILREKGLDMAGWEEVSLKKDASGRWNPNPELSGRGLHAYVWNSMGDYLDLGNRVANAGYPVVLCNVDHLYFDLAYNHHPAEPGLYWGGYVNTRKALEFAPYHVFSSTLTDRYMRPLVVDTTTLEALKPASRTNIMGIQAQIWGETLRDATMLEFYYFPRMLALAERAWTGEPSWSVIADRNERMAAMDEQWTSFAWQVGTRELPRLDHIFGGYNYRIPPPGCILRDRKIHANAAFPGLEIRYTTDGTEPGVSSQLYTGPLDPGAQIRLSAFNRHGRGSRSVEAIVK